MSTRLKEFKTTIWAIAGAIFLLVGAFVDIPQFFHILQRNGLEWLADWRVWWSGAVIGITACGIYWIWRKPTDDDKPDSLISTSSQVSFRCARLAELLADLDSLWSAILEKYPQVNSSYVFHRLEIVLPTKIKDLFGQETTSQFNSAIADAKARSSQNPLIVSETALAYLYPKIWTDIFEEYRKKEESSKEPATR